jgi:hypothetical protein
LELVLGLAFYIQLSSLRRAAGALSCPRCIGFLRPVWEWVKKFSGKVDVEPSKMFGLISRHDR